MGRGGGWHDTIRIPGNSLNLWGGVYYVEDGVFYIKSVKLVEYILKLDRT